MGLPCHVSNHPLLPHSVRVGARGPAADRAHSGTLGDVTNADRVELDGETFEVVTRADVPGQYHFTWVSGSNMGYGFTARTSDGRSLTLDQIVSQIRSFLAQIDPHTGYIEE